MHKYGISLNCVAPGGMLTAGVLVNSKEAFALYRQEFIEKRSKYGKETPMVYNVKA